MPHSPIKQASPRSRPRRARSRRRCASLHRIGPIDLSAVPRIFHSLVWVAARRPRTRICHDSRRADKDRAHRGGTAGGRTVRAVAAQCRAADRDCRKRCRPTEQIYAFCIAQNYHDLHTPKTGSVDVYAFNHAVFRVLKPGGHHVIVEHRAQPGTSVEAAKTLHCSDPAVVRREVEAAGFEYADEHGVLHSRRDPRTSSIFARGIRYDTDGSIVKFADLLSLRVLFVNDRYLNGTAV
jgi:hypothetical protein